MTDGKHETTPVSLRRIVITMHGEKDILVGWRCLSCYAEIPAQGHETPQHRCNAKSGQECVMTRGRDQTTN